MNTSLKDLVVMGKSGDQQALEALYSETKSMIYFTILKLVKNERDAQDLVQDTYIAAFQSLSSLQDDRAFIKWLQAIALNLSKNYLKKSMPLLFQTTEEEEKTLSGIPEVSEDFLPAEYADRRETRRLVMDIVDSLPTVQRTAVILYYFDELSLREVAKVMETSEGTTKSRLNYARHQIKSKVEAEEKSGTKLYGVPALPILMKILHSASNDCPLPDALLKSILQAALVASHGAPATGSAPVAAASKTGAGLFGKLAAAALPVKITAGVLAAAVLVGGGIGISQLAGKPSAQAPNQTIAVAAAAVSQIAAAQNRDWNTLLADPSKYLGKTPAELTALLGQPDKKSGDTYFYIIDSAKQTTLQLKFIGYTIQNVSCDSDLFNIYGSKVGDPLDKLKADFSKTHGIYLIGEGLKYEGLTGIIYMTDAVHFTFLYDSDLIIRRVLFTQELRPTGTQAAATTVPSQTPYPSGGQTAKPAGTSVPATTSKPAAADWKQAYRNFIKNELQPKTPHLWYTIADLDQNGILELYTLYTNNPILDDGTQPEYAHDSEIDMYCWNGSKVAKINEFYFANAPGRLMLDYANQMLWHETVYMSQGNVIKITGYKYSGQTLTEENFVSSDSTAAAAKGGTGEEGIVYTPSKQEFERVRNKVSTYEGLNWYYVTDDVLQAIQKYLDAMGSHDSSRD